MESVTKNERVLPGDNRALASVAGQFFVNGAVLASFVPRLPGIRDRLDVDLRTIGVLISLATLGGLIGSVTITPILDRFGSKVTMSGGALGLVVLLPIIGFVTSPFQLVIVLGLLSAVDVITDVGMNVQGSAISERRDTPVMNRLHGMWSLGTVVGGSIASLMAWLDVSLQVHLNGAAVVLLAMLFWIIPGLRSDHDTPPSEESSSAGTDRASGVLVIFLLLGGAAIIPEMVNSDWAAFRLTDDLGASEGVAALAYVAFTSGMVTGRFSGDNIVVRLGSYQMLRATTAVATVGVVLATLVPALVAVFIGLFIAGLGVSLMFPQLYDNAAKAQRPGPALGGLTAGSRLALLGAPALVGVLADTATFSVGQAIALVTIPAALALLFLTPKPRSL